jgi:hypothetical protein
MYDDEGFPIPNISSSYPYAIILELIKFPICSSSHIYISHYFLIHMYIYIYTYIYMVMIRNIYSILRLASQRHVCC